MESANDFHRNKLMSKGQVSHSKTDKRKTTLLSLPSLRLPTPETSLFRMDGGRLAESFRRGPLVNHSGIKTVNKDQRTPSLSSLYHGSIMGIKLRDLWETPGYAKRSALRKSTDAIWGRSSSQLRPLQLQVWALDPNVGIHQGFRRCYPHELQPKGTDSLSGCSLAG